MSVAQHVLPGLGRCDCDMLAYKLGSLSLVTGSTAE
jgi:hypothetical protein